MSDSFYKGYLSGSVDASVVFSAVDRNILAPLLPEGAELAPQNYTEAGQHPVYWTFNFHQRNVSTPIPGLRLNYSEFAFVIPCVRFRGGSELLAFPVVLYLNSWLAEIGGRIIWQLNKRHAACNIAEEAANSSFQAEGRLTGVFQKEGAAVEASQSEHFQRIRPMLEQPLMTVGWLGRRQSQFVMDFQGAKLQPLNGEIATLNFLPGLSDSVVPFKSLRETPMGGFSFSVPWKLYLPKRIENRANSADPGFNIPPVLPPDNPETPETVEPPATKQKVVVLGAGLGGLSAAFELTDYKDWDKFYDVTVYQFGWQLGGKCRTGRGARERIEEHGIHVFLGFYNNALRMVRLAYDACKKHGNLLSTSPFQTWESLFLKQNSIQLPKYSVRDGKWKNHALILPGNNEIPGIGGAPNEHENIKKMLLTGLELLLGSPYLNRGGGCLGSLARTFMRWIWPKDQPDDPFTPKFTRSAEEHPVWRNDLLQEVKKAHGHTDLPIEKQYLHHIKKLIGDLPQNAGHAAQMAANANGAPHPHDKIAHLVFEFLSAIEKTIAPFVSKDSTLDIFWMYVQLGYYNYIGLQQIYNRETGLYDFESINHLEYREWLRQNGAPDEVIWSEPIKDIYTLVFAYPAGGDTSQPGVIAAGTALMGAMLILLGYKGSVMYRFRGGTSDVVISPVYQALKARGVKFKFFHSVEEIAYSEGSEIEKITIGEQIRLKNPELEFKPTKLIKGLDCWAAHPFWRWKELADQIHPDDLEELQKNDVNLNSAWSGWKNRRSFTLKKGVDFDQVVLAISVAGLKDICADIIEKRSEWKSMVDKVLTVQTQGVQLWVKKSLEELGVNLPEIGMRPNGKPILDTYANPLNSYADFTELLQHEDWAGREVPKSLAYFCGPLSEPVPAAPYSDTTYPAQQNARVREIATQWLFDNAAFLWPNGRTKENPTGFDFNLLVDPEDKSEATGLEKLNRQFFIANIDPSERYVLSVPNSSKHRMKTDKNGYNNLFLAGDWIDTGYNMGCAEVAVMSGLMAAQALRKNAYGLTQHKPIIKDLNQGQ